MKYIFYIVVTMLLSSGIGYSKNVSIAITTTTNLNAGELEIYYVDLDGLNVLHRQQIDNKGVVTANFDLIQNYFAILKIGSITCPMYLSKGGSYNLNIGFENNILDVQFFGKDSVLNQYFFNEQKVIDSFRFNNKSYFEWDKSEFTEGVEKLDSTLKSLRSISFSESEMSISKLSLVEHAAIANILVLKLNYAIAQADLNSPGKETRTDRIDKLISEIPYDDDLLREKSESLLLILKFAYLSSVQKRIQQIVINEGSINDELYFDLAYEEINKFKIKEQFKEIMIADLLFSILGNYYSTKLNSELEVFQKRFPNSVYSSKISKKYNALLSLNSGTNAFEITGRDSKGNVVKLSDFKGSLIYLDFWATWCGPCLKEMPNFISLQNKFRDYKNVVFLGISLDKDNYKWKEFLRAHPELKGVQINLSESEIEETMRNYLISGIPKYVIVDKNGLLYDSNSVSPSNENVEKVIKQALKLL